MNWVSGSGPVVTVALSLVAGAALGQTDDHADKVRLAAGWIGTVLDNVAASAEAVGGEFAARMADQAPATEADVEAWQQRAEQQGDTVGFRTWPADAPAFQAEVPGLYSYGGAEITPARATRLAALEATVPVVRAAWRCFDFSWVYITTDDELMLIYPFVPLDEAVYNDPPTEQVYYTAADIAGKADGWTEPYLDLVGAGMMITVSSPVFAGDELLGVASRDITLGELSASVLGRLAESGAATAVLVDGRGLAIGASDPALEAEIEQVNTAAGVAALFYRTEAGLSGLGVEGAAASAQDWVNASVEAAIAAAGDDGGVAALEAGEREVVAARIDSTGWFVVLIGEPG
jgi:hypothetical protein